MGAEERCVYGDIECFGIQRDPAFKKVGFKKVKHCFSKKSLIL